VGKNIIFKSCNKGFTLIELMVVVLVIGILASLAYPAYEQYGLRARRGVAKAFVSQLSLKEVEYFAHMRSYTGTIGTGGLGLTTPVETNGYYTYEVCTADCNGLTLPANGYIVMAHRVAGSRQMKDAVGDLALYSTGGKCTISGIDPTWGNQGC
jgi:type IV pilus assembly protein PilE